jgi:hypothetical protein
MLIQNLIDGGYTFVFKENETWREMERKDMIEKVQVSFRGWGRERVHTRKRKAVHMLQSHEKNEDENEGETKVEVEVEMEGEKEGDNDGIHNN